MDHDVETLGDLVQPGVEVGSWDVQGTGDVAGLPGCLAADVEDHEAFPGGSCGRGNGGVGFETEARCEVLDRRVAGVVVQSHRGTGDSEALILTPTPTLLHFVHEVAVELATRIPGPEAGRDHADMLL